MESEDGQMNGNGENEVWVEGRLYNTSGDLS